MLEKPIRLEDLQLENWPNIILWAAPIMFLLVFVEWGISIYQKKDTYNTKDFLAAAFIGALVWRPAAVMIFIVAALGLAAGAGFATGAVPTVNVVLSRNLNDPPFFNTTPPRLIV